eukprot:scpid44137/ scgid23103/ 
MLGRSTAWLCFLLASCGCASASGVADGGEERAVFQRDRRSSSVVSGIMQEGVGNLSCPYARTVHLKYEWTDIQPEYAAYNFTQFLVDIKAAVAAGKLVYYTIETGAAAPQWLYNNGVPRVVVNFTANDLRDFPYYLSTNYTHFFMNMTSTVRLFIASLPSDLGAALTGVDVVLGSTGDVAPWHGPAQNPKYEIPRDVWLSYWHNYTIRVVQEYRSIALKNDLFALNVHGLEDIPGLTEQLADIVGYEHLGNAAHEVCKQYQETGERLSLMWNDTMYHLMHTPHTGGQYIRAVCFQDRHLMEGNMNPVATAWAAITWSLTWNLDSMRAMEWELDAYPTQIWPMLKLFNKYAGVRHANESPGAWAYLHDGLNAADTVRFPEQTFGKARLGNADRMKAIAEAFSWAGARQDDPHHATQGTQSGRQRTAWNDVGWEILPTNYNMYLTQLDPVETTDGRWRVGNANSTEGSNFWGRFARSFNHLSGKNVMLFQLDRNLSTAFTSGSVHLRIVYLDDNAGQFSIYYSQDAPAAMPVSAAAAHNSSDDAGLAGCAKLATVRKAASNTWLTAAYNVSKLSFSAACQRSSNIVISNDDVTDDVIAFIELSLKPYDDDLTYM